MEWHGTAPRRVKQKRTKRPPSDSADLHEAHHSSTCKDVADVRAAFGPQARHVIGFPLSSEEVGPATTAAAVSGNFGSSVVVKTGCNADRAAVIDLHIALEPELQVRDSQLVAP